MKRVVQCHCLADPQREEGEGAVHVIGHLTHDLFVSGDIWEHEAVDGFKLGLGEAVVVVVLEPMEESDEDLAEVLC